MKLEEVIKKYRALIPTVRRKHKAIQQTLVRIDGKIQAAEEEKRKTGDTIKRLELELKVARLLKKKLPLIGNSEEYSLLCKVLLYFTTPEFQGKQLEGFTYSFFAKSEEQGEYTFSRYRTVYLSDSPTIHRKCKLCMEEHPVIYASRREEEYSMESDPYKGAWREKTGKIFSLDYLIAICSNKARISFKEELPKAFEENHRIIYQNK